MKIEDLKGKGPLIIGPDGKPTDVGLFDMVADDKYDRLLTLRLAKKAIKNVLKKKNNNIKESKEEKFKKLSKTYKENPLPL